MQSVLISGLGKTGTTGVYNAVKDALRATGVAFNGQFEPTKPDPLLALGRYDPHTPILTKVMAQRLDEVRVRYEDFDRRVMTVRDPRDVVISRLLFFPLIRGAVQRQGHEATDRFVEALRAKEADPQSRSVVGLYEFAAELGLTRASWRELADAFDLTSERVHRHDFHVVRYEDFVDGELAGLSDYLGLAIENPAATGGAWLGHIPRSMSHGEWRNWFTTRDVEFFGELFGDYMRRHGYDPSQGPNAEPKVDPATSSEHVEQKLESRRAQVESRYSSWEPGRPMGLAEFELLVGMADDGDGVAGYRAALALTEGAVKDDGAPPALELARGAAKRGHVEAMALVSRLIRDDGVSPEASRAVELEARFWDRESELGGVTVPPLQDAGRVEDLEAEVRRLRRRLRRTRAQRDALAASRRYQVGSLVADLLRGPFSRRRRAAGRLLRLSASIVRSRVAR